SDVVLHTDWTGWASDTYFYNNIFYVEGAARFSYGVTGNPDGSYASASGAGKSTNNVYDYNIYYGVEPAADPHAMTGDPLLINAGKAGTGRATALAYSLQAHSPAIGSGKIVDGPSGKDFFGANVPPGSVDRGAVQSQSSCDTPR